MKNRVIAIDGPSGAGKSTIAKGIGKRMGFLHVDSGSLYRIMTLAAIKAGIDCNDEEAVAAGCDKVDVRFVVKDGAVAALVEGKEPGDAIRTAEINAHVSPVSKVPEVRERINIWLRGMRELGDIVVEGRDIGSVVFPDTPARFFLNASAEARAIRRHLEEVAKGIATQTVEEVKASLLNRDKIDSSRKTAPLKIPEGAIVIDSTNLSIEEVLDIVEKNARAAFGI
jgi:cytidylate kinase